MCLIFGNKNKSGASATNSVRGQLQSIRMTYFLGIELVSCCKHKERAVSAAVGFAAHCGLARNSKIRHSAGRNIHNYTQLHECNHNTADAHVPHA